MKKFLILLLACCLCCSMAFAEVKTTEVSSLSLNRDANTFVIRTDSRKYQVVDSDLNPLSEEYDSLSTSYGLYTVRQDDGSRGLLDGQGKVLIAPQYDDVNVISDKWATGIRLVEATAENYDYKSWGNETKFYLIDTVDLYYLGTKLHTFTRMEFDNAYAFGDYIVIQDREKKCTAYSKDFVLSSYVPESAYSEYDENWNTGRVTHIGSGQEAFVAGCALTPEEVQKSVWIKKNSLVDLQGNVLADLTEYYTKSIDSSTNLIKVQDNYKKRGILDSTGKVLIPCKYDELGYDLDLALATGWLYAVKDGKGGFVSLVNGAEKGFDFLESAGKQRSAFIVVEDPREGTILISAAAGELPGRFKSAEVPYSSAAMYATVEDMAGTIRVIDVFGNEVLEDNPEIKSVNDVDYSKDGTVILVRDIERKYHIYLMDTSVYAQNPEAAAAPVEEDDGTWTCENGHSGNTAKFCTTCGAPKPAEEGDGTWTCENGHEGNTGAFCGECGAKKPE